MKKMVGIVAVLLLLSWAGCKKDSTSSSAPRIKVYYAPNDTVTYTYYPDGRIATYIDGNGQTITYSYSSSDIYIIQNYNGTVTNDTIHLNSAGYIGDVHNIKHFYDSDGFLI